MSNKHRRTTTRSDPKLTFDLDGTEVRFYQDAAVLLPAIAADCVAEMLEHLVQGPLNCFLCTPWRLYSVSVENRSVSAFETARPYAYAALLHALKTHPQGWPNAPVVLDLQPVPRPVYVVSMKRGAKTERKRPTLH